jgi:valyl-tRNA synthetase
MPFVTEELWQHLRPRADGETIMQSQLTRPDAAMVDHQVDEEMAFVQNVIEAVRNIRGEMSIAPSREISLVMKMSQRSAESVRKYEGYLQRLARVREILFPGDGARPKLSASSVVQGEELFVPLEGVIDIDVERTRLKKEIDRVSTLLAGIRGKLDNKSFVARAPQDVVEKEREKMLSFGQALEKLEKSYAALS